jgi:2'-5' RNA ligase
VPEAPSVRHHNEILRRGEKRARELEDILVDLLIPILEEAGEEAAAAFRQVAVDHVAASADLRRLDRERISAIGLEEARNVLASLALTAAAPDMRSTSTMIALYPRPEEAEKVAVPGREPPELLHVTLAYLGDTDEDDPLSDVVDALRAVAGEHSALTGEVGGAGYFADQGEGHPAILLPDVPGLVELRMAVCERIAQMDDADYSRLHGFTPHMTVAYVGPDESLDTEAPFGEPLHFDALYLVRGDQEVARVPLAGPPPVTAALTAAAGRFCLPAALRTKTDPVRLAVIESMMKESLQGVGLMFDATNPFAARVLSQSASQITHISKTTQLDVMRVIRAAYDEGLSIPDTAKAIQAHMREASPARARLIARTELVGAVNGGSLAATQIVADATGEMFYKKWLTAAGAKNPRHARYPGLNGQTVELDDHFNVGGHMLEHPGDPAGPPEEICNCRCALAYTDEPPGKTGLIAPASITASVEEEIDEAAASLTAAGPAGWSVPAGSEVLEVDCHAPATNATLLSRQAREHLDDGLVQPDRSLGVRPWIHYKDNSLDAQLTKARRAVRQAADPAHKIRAQKLLDELIEEKQIRRGALAEKRPWEHYKDTSLNAAMTKARREIRQSTSEAQALRWQNRLAELERERELRRGGVALVKKERVVAKEVAVTDVAETAVFNPGTPSDHLQLMRAASLGKLKEGVIYRANAGTTMAQGDLVYTAGEGWVTTYRGVTIFVEDGVAYSASAAAEIIGKHLDEALKHIHPQAAGELHQVLVLNGKNPADSYWAKQYKMPGFQSAAVGGNGRVTFWRTGSAAMQNPQTFYHELGHVFGVWGGAPDIDAWRRAQRLDMAWNGPDGKLRMKGYTSGGPLTGQAVTGESSITAYASNSANEEWAESVRLWLESKTGRRSFGTIKDKNGFLRPATFEDVYPNRAKIIEQEIGPLVID